MTTLKRLVKEREWSGMSDIQIIKTFFEENDMEEEGMELIQQLTQTKIAKLKHRQRVVEEWTSHLPSKYLYEHYDLDMADNLHRIELDYLSHGCELSNNWLKWAEENIPNIEMPQWYFQPLIEYLDDKGIRFKGEQPIENKLFSEYV